MYRPRPVPVTKNNLSYLMNSDYNTDGDTEPPFVVRKPLVNPS